LKRGCYFSLNHIKLFIYCYISCSGRHVNTSQIALEPIWKSYRESWFQQMDLLEMTHPLVNELGTNNIPSNRGEYTESKLLAFDKCVIKIFPVWCGFFLSYIPQITQFLKSHKPPKQIVARKVSPCIYGLIFNWEIPLNQYDGAQIIRYYTGLFIQFQC